MVLDEEVNGEREDQFLKDAGLFLFLQKLSIDKCDCMMRKFDDEFFIVDVDEQDLMGNIHRWKL